MYLTLRNKEEIIIESARGKIKILTDTFGYMTMENLKIKELKK